MKTPLNILVLCTGNSARSILLEALLNRLGKGRVRAQSAGSQPVGRVNPHAVALLTAQGFETAGLRSKSWDLFAAPDAPEMQLVVTVCASAAGEACPLWPGAPVRAHWGIDDPASAPEDRAVEAFEKAYNLLKDKAEEFLALPLEDLELAQLQAEVTRMGAAA